MDKGHRERRIHQKQSKSRRFCFNEGWFRSFLGILFGLLFVISFHTGIAVATNNINDWLKTENQAQSSNAIAQILQPPATSSAQLVQQAEDHYQAGQLADAIALWQQAADRYEKDGNRLNQALMCSFLATAFDHRGQWAPAKGAIEKAIEVLNTANPAAKTKTTAVFAQVLTT